MSVTTLDGSIPAEAPSQTADAEPHIGVLILNTKQRIGSAQHVHGMIARFLDKDRFKVFVATPPESNEPVEWEGVDDVTIWRLPLGFSASTRQGITGKLLGAVAGAQLLAGLVPLIWLIRRNRIGIIHTATTPRDALSGFLLSKATGAKLVIHWHHVFWGWYPAVWRLAFRRASAILAVSKQSFRSLLPLGIEAEKIHVLYNGIDTERCRPDLASDGARQELLIPERAQLVLLPGRLCPIKGQGDLLQAVAILKERNHEVFALLVGDDDPYATPGGGSYRAELENLCGELGIQEQVRIVGYRSDMPRLMAAADIIAVPSYDDPFPLVVLEAMACGKPVIGTDSGGIPEEITDGVSGLLVSTGSAEELAEAIERLLVDEPLRRRLSENARREAEHRFSQEQMARNAAKIYETLIRQVEPTTRCNSSASRSTA